MLTQSLIPQTTTNFNSLMRDIYGLINDLPEWVNYLQLLGMRGEGEIVCITPNHNFTDLSHDCLMGRRFDLKKIAFTSYELGCLQIDETWTTVLIWKDSTGQTCYQGF